MSISKNNHRKNCQCPFCNNKIGDKNPMFGKKHSEITKIKMSKRGKGKSLELREKIGEATKRAITIHHLDGNHSNDSEDNRVKLPMKYVSKIHFDAYKFIVEKGLLREYILKFQEKYNIKIRRENGQEFCI